MTAKGWLRDAPFAADGLANHATSRLRAYDPGHDLPVLRHRFGDAIAELGSNENPLGPSPRALAAMHDSLAACFRYPDPRGSALKARIATKLSVGVDNIALGNGSHELLMLVAQCFADASHSIVHSQYGFAVFAIAAAAAGAQHVAVPALAREDVRAPLGHDLSGIASAVRDDTRLVYLANPNNPTGTWFDNAALATLMDRVPRHVLVVVDEAYQEYVDADACAGALSLMSRFPNLIVTRTFSKAHGLAGLRCGYLIADSSVIAVLERLRESFNVNHVALAAAVAALDDDVHLSRVRATNAVERSWLADAINGRGHATLPSSTNFILVDFDRDASAIEHHLFERGVIVRPMGGYGLAHMLRISIGTRSENERLLDALT